MALGHIANANVIVQLNHPLQKEATEAHTVSGLKHNLLSINRLTKSGHKAQLKDVKVSFFNANGDHHEAEH